MNHRPPKRPLQFLRWFCREDCIEEIEGDLTEVFIKQPESNLRQAKWKFTWSVMKYFRPAFMKSFRNSYQPNSYAMIKSYFKIGWRSLVKQKMYSAIKIGGFALGIAACLLIALFIQDELGYDKQYTNEQSIYRVVGAVNGNNGIERNTFFPAPMSAALKEDFPEVLKAGRYNAGELFGAGSNEVRPGDQIENSYDEGFAYFDQELADMLPLKFIHGSAARALEQPNSIVITQRKAEKYFPNQNPVGKILIINNEANNPYTVSGVVENFSNTHLPFDFLISTKGLEFWQGEQKDWGASNYAIYIWIDPSVNPKELEKKISKGIIDKYVLPMMVEGGMSEAEAKQFMQEKNAHLQLQPLSEIHLYSSDVQDGLVHGDIRFVWMFGGIAVFILLIAIINFINLSTAKSANRAKEVGLRKVVGSMRQSVIHQFLTESVLFSILSFGVGLMLALALLPYFNMLSSKTLCIPWADWKLIPVMLLLAIFVGVLAGLYPSLYLSSFQPIQVLKGSISKGSKSSPLRSTLVIFQFTTSIVLIIGTFVIYQQMEFILNKKIGFEKDQVVIIQGTNTLGQQTTTFKNELLNIPHVEAVTVSDYLPIRGTKRNGNQFWVEGKSGNDESVNGQIWKVDHDYISTLGMNIVEGRNFDVNHLTDSSALIVNQSMAKQLGGDVIGKRILNGGQVSWTIIGVVEDFHFESMKENIGNLCLRLGNSPSMISVKASSTDMQELLTNLTEKWKKFAPHQPTRFAFLDDRYAAMYADVQRMGRIFTTFAVLAIIVACLGLFALSAFMIEQRTKEIGIRLVMGASLQSVFSLLTFNFIKLVFIAIAIAVPLSWYLMQQWLQDFAYRTEITWVVFALAGFTAVLIALVTVSFQAIKAAIANPVNSLKSE
jgi:putative ABC transport system permease protein